MVSAESLSVAVMAKPAVEAALKSIAPTIMSKLGRVAQAAGDKAIAALHLGFREYLETSYNKCKTFKSILRPQEPIEVISHYVNVRLTCHTQQVDDITLIESLYEKRRIVVTGLAGSGKSMFMKYLTLHHFHFPHGRVPLFVELRHINSLTKRDLLAFIRSSCCSKNHQVTQEQFELGLRSGAFILILDGFDELNHDIRADLEKQILTLDRDFPESPIIISSRPDDRFSSWSSYFVYKVDALDKAQVVKLIESLEYTPGVKKRFLREIKISLYESHTSFLSSPLLASIMLLTYESFAEIPQKMHSFYGQAFDTLFQKHDAQKEQYQRQMHTQITRDAFKECFAAFCAMSYLNEQYSFSTEQLEETADAAIRYVDSSGYGISKTISGKQLIADLLESVCMLQPDGVETSFVHRSFQEYFCAVFVRSLSGEKVKKFIDRCSARFGDNMIPMAMDMGREVLENEWVLPTIAEIESQIDLKDAKSNFGKKYQALLPKGYLLGGERFCTLHASTLENAKYPVIECLSRLYPNHLKRLISLSPFVHLRDEDIQKALDNNKDKAATATYKKLAKLLEHSKMDRHSINAQKPFFLAEQEDWLFLELGSQRTFEALAKSFNAIKRELQGRERKKKAILTEFLN